MSKPEGVKIATIETKAIPASEAKKGTPAQHPQRESIEDPRKIIRQGLLVVFLFFGVLGTWAVFGEISGAIVAPGKVKIETERKTVQHLEGGIVESILVREGEEVQEGQPLIVLESVQVDASENMLQKQLVALLAAQTRSAAEKELKTDFTWPAELVALAANIHSEDVLANEKKIFTARREALDGQISLLKSQIAQIDAQILGYQDQMQAEQAIIGTLNEELKAKRQLYAERYLEKSQILELERMLASHEGNRGRMRQSIAEARQKRAELLLRIEDAKNRFVEEATNQLGKLDNEILQTRERIRPLKDAKKRLQVVAPVKGRVVGLKVHSKGGVVRPGEPLMDIVPENTPLIIETQVPVNKITDVFIGQDALVQLDAFDTRVGRPSRGAHEHGRHAVLPVLCGNRSLRAQGCQAVPLAGHARHGVHHDQEAHGPFLYDRTAAEKLGTRAARIAHARGVLVDLPLCGRSCVVRGGRLSCSGSPRRLLGRRGVRRRALRRHAAVESGSPLRPARTDGAGGREAFGADPDRVLVSGEGRFPVAAYEPQRSGSRSEHRRLREPVLGGPVPVPQIYERHLAQGRRNFPFCDDGHACV